MKRYSAKPPMDEREKFRKFRELDDAFGDALRALDKESSKEADTKDEEVAGTSTQQHFEQRLTALMKEYRQSPESVSELLCTLLALGKIA